MQHSFCHVGVDYGGTWVRMVAANEKGTILRSAKEHSPPLKKLPEFFKSVFRKWKIEKIKSLVLGAKGVWTKGEKNLLRKRLFGMAQNVVVLSDIEAVYKATFGNGAGVMILAGTGSIAYGRNGGGNFARAGGLGPDKGDEGSGFWIGKKWLERTKRKIPKKSVREIAALATYAIENAERGNPFANQIVRAAQEHLISLVLKVGSELQFKNEVMVSWAGGLFQNLFFRRGFCKVLHARMGSNILKIVPPKIEVAEWAALLSFRAADSAR